MEACREGVRSCNATYHGTAWCATRLSGIWLFGVAIVSLQMTAEAQAQSRVRINGHPERLSEAFTLLTGMAELSSGAIVVLDAGEKRVALVDREWRQATTISRPGGGPNEITYPVRVLPLAGGRAAVDDAENQRWIILGPDGAPAGQYPLGAADEPTRVQRRASGVPVSDGSMLFESRGIGGKRLLVRLGATGGEARTVAVREPPGLVGRPIPPVRQGNFAPAAKPGSLPPYRTPRDVWTASLDGWVAVVTAEPYRVTMHAPDGRTIAGSPIAVRRVEPTERTKRAMVQELKRHLGWQASPDGRYEWPDSLPAFHTDRFRTLFFAPDGRLWVRRTTLTEDSESYDVFSRDAALAGSVVVPEGSRLLGLGARHAYLVVKDTDDLEYVERVVFDHRIR